MSDAKGEVLRLIESRVPVYMAGIGGVGMAGLALLLRARGVDVSGADLQGGPFVSGLQAAGVPVHRGHVAGHVADTAGWVIRSAAVPDDQPDLVHAHARGLPIFRRGEVLPMLVDLMRPSVAIAGTHGKTTTATIVAQLMRVLEPSWCIGGVSAPFALPGGVGTGPLVVEADESDGTLAFYAADVALISNVDFDHMEHFASEEALDACFGAFARQARNCVVYCADDSRASAIGRSCGKRCLGYGFGASADVRGLWDGRQHLRVMLPGEAPLELALPAELPGRHNALNLLGAIAVCHALDVPVACWRQQVMALRLPARRFDVLADVGGIRVISDYAHHPAEIRALVQMVRELHDGRVLGIFQPHRYTRTLALRDAFPSAFEGVDALVLAPVYGASEAPLRGGETDDLRRAFDDASVVSRVVQSEGVEAAAHWIQQEMRPGDWILVIGAGDVERAGGMLADAIRGLNDVA